MCALFTLKTSYKDLLESFGRDFSYPSDVKEWDQRFLPHQEIPVLIKKEGTFTMNVMNFSLIPHWSKVRRPKFATHNARLETLCEKPTWREPLVRRHGLIPLTEFIEPIYEGEHRGYMLGFSEAHEGLLWAAALWDEWLDRETGEVIPSASIITHHPSDFVAAMGHDREPLFINTDYFEEWLTVERGSSEIPLSQKTEGAQWTTFLQRAHKEPSLKIRRDRVLKNVK